jgi:tagatose 6-phosphate kinase
MIVTVTPNPALDLTYAVGALVPHGSHRVTSVAERPGGKGLNVARVLRALGEPVLATGLLGGGTGARVASLLDAGGVPHAFTAVDGETRRTVTVVDPGDATGFNEPGPVVTPAEWARFEGHFRSLLGSASVVTLSGSIPLGVPASAYAGLIPQAGAAGVPVVLDASGEALRLGLGAAPALAKPNADEFADLAAATVSSPPEVIRAVRALTGTPIVLSRGASGLLAVLPGTAWLCAPPGPVIGNPTGAGDACVAALARGLHAGSSWPDMLADAVALSAAAVATPTAGTFDPGVYRRLRDAVTVTEIPGGTRVRTHR